LNPLALIFIIIGLPALAGLAYVFVSGSIPLRRFVITRIGLTVPMVLILASLVFFVMRILPGDPVRSSLGPKGSPETVERMQESLGLNDPIMVQYGKFIGNVVTFDFGESLTGGRRPVVDEMSERFPATLELVIPSAALALAIGIVGGTIAANRRKRPTDYVLRLYSVVIYSIPIFWFGLILQLVFGVALGWFPIAGRIDPVLAIGLERPTNLLLIDTLIHGEWAAFRSALAHLVLPVTALGLVLSGVFLRLTRINVIETLQMDYIGAARARGIRERVVVGHYALKNAIIPVITLLGLQVAILLAGAVLTETVFSWPGMGQYLVQRISARDYTAVQGVITMFAMLVALISLAVDILYSLVDPRVGY
jgi:peptide/nickel transport system permease protein